MDKRSLVLYLSGLVASGAAVGVAASCSDQPRIKCTAGHGTFAVLYTHLSGDPGCAPGTRDSTGMPLAVGGEEVGVEAYSYPLDDNSNLDPNRGSLGMQSMDLTHRIGERPNGDDTRKAYSLGDWGSSEPGPDDFCSVPSMNEAEQHLDWVAPTFFPDGGVEHHAVQRENIKYTWTNVRFFNTPASPGTQLIADLEYSRAVATADGGAPGTPCVAKVKAIGLWPVKECAKDGDTTHLEIDETKCSPLPDNTKGRPTGSGISPDIAYKCDPNLKLCVLAKDPPSFK